MCEAAFPDLKNDKEESNEVDFLPVSSFVEITPLDYEIENSSRKELSSIPISDVDFPKVVFMIVDNKIELQTKLLSDYPQWQFLAKEELDRNTCLLYTSDAADE